MSGSFPCRERCFFPGSFACVHIAPLLGVFDNVFDAHTVLACVARVATESINQIKYYCISIISSTYVYFMLCLQNKMVFWVERIKGKKIQWNSLAAHLLHLDFARNN